MRPLASGGIAPAQSPLNATLWEDFMSNLPPSLTVEEVVWANLPSPHLSLTHMLELSAAIDQALMNKKIFGVIVLHGTDLLPETAFVLEMTLKTTKPVVVTGSMRHLSEAGYDGVRNLNNALRICLKMPLGCEVVVTMGDEIYAARDVFKQNSLAANSMSSQAGILGRAIETEIIFYQHPPIAFSHSFNAKALLAKPLPEVALLSAYPGMDGSLVDLLRQKGIKGLVIDAFGAGNVPPRLGHSLKAALSDKIPVIICTRCPQGGAHAIYAYEGGGRDLHDHGAILSGNIPATKAQLFLQIALSSNYENAQIQDFFSNKSMLSG